MRLRILGGGAGAGLLDDVTVFLVGNKGSKAAQFLRDVFPTRATTLSDGSIEFPIVPGAGSTPQLVDRVEIESPRLTFLIYALGALVAGLLVTVVVLMRK